MATFSATLARVHNGAGSGGTMPVPQSVPVSTSTTITTSGTSQQASNTGKVGETWVLTVSGGNVWVAFGSNPTAAAGTSWLMLAGTTREFSVTAASEKVAVVDA